MLVGGTNGGKYIGVVSNALVQENVETDNNDSICSIEAVKKKTLKYQVSIK